MRMSGGWRQTKTMVDGEGAGRDEGREAEGLKTWRDLRDGKDPRDQGGGRN